MVDFGLPERGRACVRLPPSLELDFSLVMVFHFDMAFLVFMDFVLCPRFLRASRYVCDDISDYSRGSK